MAAMTSFHATDFHLVNNHESSASAYAAAYASS